MKLGSGKAWAKTIGSALAHVQDAVDSCAEWGFAKLKQAGKQPKTIDVSEPTVLRRAKGFLRSTVSFIGQLGQGYFDEYEEIKKRKK